MPSSPPRRNRSLRYAVPGALLLTALSLYPLPAGPRLIRAEGPDPQALRAGRSLYIEHCSVCHGDQARGDGPLSDGTSVRPANLEALAREHDAYWFYSRITMGWRQMHAKRHDLSDDVRWRIARFLASLSAR